MRKKDKISVIIGSAEIVLEKISPLGYNYSKRRKIISEILRISTAGVNKPLNSKTALTWELTKGL